MKAGNFLYNFLRFFTLVFISQSLYAQDNSHMAQIVASARLYLEEAIEKQSGFSSKQHVNITSHELDSRLQLKRCDKPLTFSHNTNAKISGITSVKASCRGSHPWSIYTKHRVSTSKSVIVINKTLPKHHIIQANDISLAVRDTIKLRNGYITDQSLVIGQKLRRPIKEGDAVYHHQLSAPKLIKKGDKVNIAAKTGSLTVVTSGIALDNGRKGEQIDVENLRSSRVIRTRVIGRNRVEVIF